MNCDRQKQQHECQTSETTTQSEGIIDFLAFFLATLQNPMTQYQVQQKLTFNKTIQTNQ
jgi:hypothetical protein